MVTVDNSGNITISRGDTFKLPLFIDCDKNIFNMVRFPLKEGDKIFFFLVEPNTSIRHYLLKQTYTKEDVNENGDIMLKFINQDTSWIAPGTYYYEIKLQRQWEEAFKDALITIVPRRKFVIL